MTSRSRALTLRRKQPSVQDGLLTTMQGAARKMATSHYLISHASYESRSDGAFAIITVQPQAYSLILTRRHEFRVALADLRRGYARAAAWARRDAAIVAMACRMCEALSLNPEAPGPYPFGPPIPGPLLGNGGVGYSQVMQAPPLVQQNKEWLWPHAAIAFAVKEAQA